MSNRINYISQNSGIINMKRQHPRTLENGKERVLGKLRTFMVLTSQMRIQLCKWCTCLKTQNQTTHPRAACWSYCSLVRVLPERDSPFPDVRTNTALHLYKVMGSCPGDGEKGTNVLPPWKPTPFCWTTDPWQLLWQISNALASPLLLLITKLLTHSFNIT